MCVCGSMIEIVSVKVKGQILAKIMSIIIMINYDESDGADDERVTPPFEAPPLSMLINQNLFRASRLEMLDETTTKGQPRIILHLLIL